MLRACSRFERWDDKRARHFCIVCLVVFYWSISSNKCAHFTLQGAPCLRQVELSWTLKFGRVPVQWMKAAKPRALFVGESQKSNWDLRTPVLKFLHPMSYVKPITFRVSQKSKNKQMKSQKKQDFGSPYPITFFVLLFFIYCHCFYYSYLLGAAVLPCFQRRRVDVGVDVGCWSAGLMMLLYVSVSQLSRKLLPNFPPFACPCCRSSSGGRNRVSK